MNAQPDNPLLEVCHLRVAYRARGGGECTAVDDVSFSICRGETVGLLGESGCGKSTMALSLLGLLPEENTRQEGIIRFNSHELQNCSERDWEKLRGAEISLISQDPALALSPVRRVGEQIADVLHAHRPWKRSRCREEAEQLLLSVQLTDVRRIFSSFPFQLSGGQLQRIVIAQALACGPSLVIADEPTSALDSIIRAEILGLLHGLKLTRDIALLFISHEPEILAALADRILVMKEGRIVEQGTFAQLRHRPKNAFTRELLGAMRLSASSVRCAQHGEKSKENTEELAHGEERS